MTILPEKCRPKCYKPKTKKKRKGIDRFDLKEVKVSLKKENKDA